MTIEIFAALLTFAFVTAVTPGPNNVMLMASGVNFGFRRTIPHMVGVALGHAFMVFLVGIGLMGAFIGAELSAAKPYWLGQNVAVLEGGPGQDAYVAALKQLHVPVMQADAQRMTLEGLIRGWRRLSAGG